MVIFKKIFYLFIHERHRKRERGRDTGRGRSRLHARSLMWDSNQRIRDHALSQRQMLNHLAAQVSLQNFLETYAIPNLPQLESI